MKHDVTQLLQQIESGNKNAANELLPLIYDQLRALASKKMHHEPAGQTLQGTALVHEAYIKLVGGNGQANGQQWQNRRHFFAAASEAMRRILVDNARRKRSAKHGGDRERVLLEDVAARRGASQDDVLAISEALEKFALEEPEKAELVKLRYFGGLTLPEIAEVLGISRATASRHWAYAKAWLFDEIFSENS